MLKIAIIGVMAVFLALPLKESKPEFSTLIISYLVRKIRFRIVHYLRLYLNIQFFYFLGLTDSPIRSIRVYGFLL